MDLVNVYIFYLYLKINFGSLFMKSCLMMLFSFCLIASNLHAAAPARTLAQITTRTAVRRLAANQANLTPAHAIYAQTCNFTRTHYSTYLESEQDNYDNGDNNDQKQEQQKNDPTNPTAAFDAVRVGIDGVTARLENAAHHAHTAHPPKTAARTAIDDCGANGDAVDTAPHAIIDTVPVATAGETIGGADSAADAGSSAASGFEFPNIDGECCIQ